MINKRKAECQSLKDASPFEFRFILLAQTNFILNLKHSITLLSLLVHFSFKHLFRSDFRKNGNKFAIPHLHFETVRHLLPTHRADVN